MRALTSAGMFVPASAQQPEFKTLKVDFMPGEKAIFFDDFTDTAAGRTGASSS